jgi:Ceramidase
MGSSRRTIRTIPTDEPKEPRPTSEFSHGIGSTVTRMHRDRRPIIIAGATAVVSCGALALGIWRGWLGVDVGRGANFCDAAREWVVRQPANTFSNVGFVAAGLLIAWHAGAREDIGTSLPAHRRLATAMASLVVLLGPGSAAMHATQSAIGGHLDMLSMYLIASFAVAYATMRWLRGGIQLFAVTFVGGVAFCELVGAWGGGVPVVMSSGNAAFALLLVAATVLEVLIMRRGEAYAQRAYAYASLASILSAFVIWNAAKARLCDPHSLVQGHAIWHILGAVAAYFLYRFYASEEVGHAPRARPEAALDWPPV